MQQYWACFVFSTKKGAQCHPHALKSSADRPLKNRPLTAPSCPHPAPQWPAALTNSHKASLQRHTAQHNCLPNSTPCSLRPTEQIHSGLTPSAHAPQSTASYRRCQQQRQHSKGATQLWINPSESSSSPQLIRSHICWPKDTTHSSTPAQTPPHIHAPPQRATEARRNHQQH